MKFRRKPDTKIYEPVQWDGWTNINNGVCECIAHKKPHVHTMHDGQIVELEKGDWIMPEPDGEHFYPIKPDVFENNFERIE